MCHGTNSTWLNPTLTSRMLRNKSLSLVERFVCGVKLLMLLTFCRPYGQGLQLLLVRNILSSCCIFCSLDSSGHCSWLFSGSLSRDFLIDFQSLFVTVCLCSLSCMQHHLLSSCFWDHVLCFPYVLLLALQSGYGVHCHWQNKASQKKPSEDFKPSAVC